MWSPAAHGTELADFVRADCPIVVDVRHKQFEFTGPTEYGQFIDRQLERFSLFQFVLLNTVLRIDTERGVAAARVYMQEVRQNVSDGRRTDAYGVYHDRLERGRRRPLVVRPAELPELRPQRRASRRHRLRRLRPAGHRPQRHLAR